MHWGISGLVFISIKTMSWSAPGVSAGVVVDLFTNAGLDVKNKSMHWQCKMNEMLFFFFIVLLNIIVC